MPFEDILYEARDGVAWITINRPGVRNAFRAQTVDEMVAAFRAAWGDEDVGVVVLTGAGDKAFCAGGDQKERGAGGYGGKSGIGLDVASLHSVIRNIPKPVIAMVNGFAIGGGHVLHVLCDLSIAADTAVFGQVGPRVGSVDPGFGTAYLARIVGEKKAREIWFLCRQYSRRGGAGDGSGQQGRARRRAARRGRGVVPRAAGDEPDGAQAGEVLVQRRHRPHPRHHRDGVQRPRALLSDAGGRRGTEERLSRSASRTFAKRGAADEGRGGGGRGSTVGHRLTPFRSRRTARHGDENRVRLDLHLEALHLACRDRRARSRS